MDAIRKMIRISLFCCLGMSHWGLAQTAQVHIAGSNYPAKFDDTSLSFTNRKRIASDLTILLAVVPSFEELKGREIKAGVFQLSWLSSKALDGFFLLDDAGKKSMIIDKTASDKYLNAFAVMDAHASSVQKANEIVTLLNSNRLASQPMQVLKDLYRCGYFSNLSEDYSPPEDEVWEILNEMQKWRYLGVSALCFETKKAASSDGAEIPQVLIFTLDKATSTKVGTCPLVFDNGKWKRKWMP